MILSDYLNFLFVLLHECICVHPIVPVLGMLCGNAVTGISVSLGYILKELE